MLSVYQSIYLRSSMERASDYCLTTEPFFQAYHGKNKLFICWDDLCFALDKHHNLNYYSTSLLLQQSTGRYVSPFRHIILTIMKSVFAPTPFCSILSGELANANFMINIGDSWPRIKLMIICILKHDQYHWNVSKQSNNHNRLIITSTKKL